MDSRNQIIEYFSISKKTNTLGNSYLFVGNEYSLVYDIIKLINCKDSVKFCDICWDCKMIHTLKHPDIFLAEPDPLVIKIDKIKEALKFTYLKSFRLKHKALIIKGADSMGDEAANAFLKTLEEPPKNTFIALCVQSIDKMLSTIVSRCRKIFLPPSNETIPYMNQSLVQDIISGKIEKLKDRQELKNFLFTFTTMLRDYIITKVSNENNRLLPTRQCEIIFKNFTVKKAYSLLQQLLKVYDSYDSINEKLALNLLRVKL